MREIFRGWRRKLGMVMFGLACVFVIGWIRSMLTDDYVSGFNHSFYFSKARFAIGPHLSLDVRNSAWYSRPGLFQPTMDFSGTAYWKVAIPLTLLSACLHLWQSRRAKPKA